MRQVERVVLWAAIAGLLGWHLGRAHADGQPMSVQAALTFLDARVDLEEDLSAWSKGASALYRPMLKKADELDEKAEGAADKRKREEFASAAKAMRERAKRYEKAALEEEAKRKPSGK